MPVKFRGSSRSLNKRFVSSIRVFIVALIALVGIPATQAQTYQTIFSFDGNDGAYSSAGFVHDAEGNLYSTTQAGGLYNFGLGGTVYKLDQQLRQTVLYSFCAATNCTDGGVPLGGVTLDSAGNLYGATSSGGAYGYGAVFELNAAGVESVLYSFQGLASADGASPGYGNVVVDSAGNLYGTTLNGGLSCSQSTTGCGIIYKIDAAGKESILHSFTGGIDGGVPAANLIGNGTGVYYGTTQWGGTFNCGEIFKLGDGGNFKVLYSFDCDNDVWFPSAAPILGPDGVLYGTGAFGGGSSRGGVFKFDLSTGTETVLYSFLGGADDGCVPGTSSLILDSQGNLYGSTSDCGATGYGVIFQIDPSGQETILYNFENDGVPQGTMLRNTLGDLLGTTYFDPNFGCCGTVFRLTPASNISKLKAAPNAEN
jgi:uncharacterized repeat protein (TIGR03803 family)